jgi:hypothetical protein
MPPSDKEYTGEIHPGIVLVGVHGPIKLACAISCLMLLSSVTALAETTWDVLERFGLAGVWGISCAQPANPKSFHTIFSKGSDGRAIREIDYGAGYPILLTIVEDAQIISPSKLKFRVRNADPNWGKRIIRLTKPSW